MAATYKDIQRLTGLSLATISKYFNGGQVRKANRLAIEDAIKELDFHVNESGFLTISQLPHGLLQTVFIANRIGNHRIATGLGNFCEIGFAACRWMSSYGFMHLIIEYNV